MICVLWVLTSIPHGLLALSELPQPVNVLIISINFIHMLTWEPGPGTPADLYYQISVNTDMGTTWVPVAACQHVQYPLVCNMTEAFSDPRQVYITQVTAKRQGQTSRPTTVSGFLPIKDTHLDLPVVAVTPCGKNLCVDLLPQLQHLREFYNSLSYQLRINSSGAARALFFQETKSLKGTVLKNLAPGRQYCISVRISDSLVPRESNYSHHDCAITPGNYKSDPVISAVLCILSIVGLIVVILLAYTGFICLRKSHVPSVLTSIHHSKEVRVFVPHKAFLSSLSMIPTLHSPSEEKDCRTSALWDVEDSSGYGSDYKMHLAANLLSSSSPTLPLLAQPEPLPSNTSNSNSGFFSVGVFCPQPQAYLNGASKQSTIDTASLSDCLLNSANSPVSYQASLTAERIQPIELEIGVVGKTDNRDVNLHSLILGRYVEETEEKNIFDQSNVDAIDWEEHDGMSVMVPETCNTTEGPIEGTSCPVDDDDQQCEYFSYISRPSCTL
ncbi:cytokine receptor family member b2 isoform X1 [Phyllopteryx taeniolatus]|uniref:cytokine receptor family member b2 isoform X1 n=2 Tax=Phyllopteryx taeniolatus TaxID=161469 RepID=UPI002AD2A975|nr:cytokine receptor family member b2 isoform X1 [Phyllopteryx taeniolatus]